MGRRIGQVDLRKPTEQRPQEQPPEEQLLHDRGADDSGRDQRNEEHAFVVSHQAGVVGGGDIDSAGGQPEVHGEKQDLHDGGNAEPEDEIRPPPEAEPEVQAEAAPALVVGGVHCGADEGGPLGHQADHQPRPTRGEGQSSLDQPGQLLGRAVQTDPAGREECEDDGEDDLGQDQAGEPGRHVAESPRLRPSFGAGPPRFALPGWTPDPELLALGGSGQGEHQ